MICYKDMTFCSDHCLNCKCARNKANIPFVVLKPDYPLPICWASFKDGCQDYKPGGNQDDKNQL